MATPRRAPQSLQGRLPQIDLKAGLLLCGGSPELQAEILRKSAFSLAQDAHGLPGEIARSTADGASRAHSIRGLAVTIGAHDLAGSAADLERLLRAGERPSETELALFIVDVDELSALILAEVPGDASGEVVCPGQPGSVQELLGVLEEVERVLREHRAGARRELDQLLGSRSWPGDLDYHVRILCEQAGCYRFDEALETLAMLRSACDDA